MDWVETLEEDPVLAICYASELPPESAFKRRQLDPNRWTEEQALQASIELGLRRLIWLTGLQVDKKSYDMANSKHPIPSDAWTPKDVLEAYEEAKAWEEKQKRTEVEAAVASYDINHLKSKLNGPRKKLATTVVEAEVDR